jgi:aspartate aminotransferase-like enzyme
MVILDRPQTRLEDTMPGLLPHVDPDGLLEYSVVYTDRSLNHMSQAFQEVMRDIYRTLKDVYRADTVVVVPGSGTFAMEAVARQFARDRSCLVVRNGWFSFRWTQIFDRCGLPATSTVLKARRIQESPQGAFAPPPIEEVVSRIEEERPQLVLAPHVETSAGIILPDDYIQALGDATRAVGGLFILDCVASGTVWVDMEAMNIDVVVTAPQKGWSGPPCAGLVMLSERALQRMVETDSDSFACDLGKWHQIMQAYEAGGHAYHATMPTDGLRAFRDVMVETVSCGRDSTRAWQEELGRRVRALLESHGMPSVAAPGFQAPGVVVSYTEDDGIRSGKKFAEAGIQIAAGVPLQCDEGDDFRTFRVGLFGLDKLRNIERTVGTFRTALESIV